MGNCNTSKEEATELDMKPGPVKSNNITVFTFSGPDAVFIEKKSEYNLSFSDPVFFSVRNSKRDSLN